MTNHAAPFAAEVMHVSTMAAWERMIAVGVGWSRSRPAASTDSSSEKSIAMGGGCREEELDKVAGRRVAGGEGLNCSNEWPSVEDE